MRRHDLDICIVEDDGDQRALLAAQLRGLGYSVVDTACATQALQTIYQSQPRVVISDIFLPDQTGVHLCQNIRSDASLDGMYVVLMTAQDSEEQKREALDSGADDYLAKPYDLEELKSRIRCGMRFHRLQERLARAAVTDGLTGLWNHSQFRELLEREFTRSRRYGGPLAVLMLDLDHFKAINDTYGHEVGNQVLMLTARHLERTVRDTDLVARYGGEEFAVICPESGSVDARGMAERLCRTFPEHVRLAEYPDLIVRVSIGVASTDSASVGSVADLVNLSDRALYQSKRDGRNRVTICSELREAGPGDVCTDEIDRLRKEVVSLSMRTKAICLQSVWALIQALEARDGYSAWHSRNVTLYCKWLAEAAGWPKSLRLAVANAAMLHDLGKIGVPDGLLLKPRTLEPNEAALMRQVPLITCKILEPLRVFETEIAMIRHLRERFDGAGYPDGLVGKSIPLGSRLIAVAEAFDSITCNRAYRPGRSMDDAIEVLQDERRKQFDPEFVDLLVECVRKRPRRWAKQVELARVPPGKRSEQMQ